MKKIGVIHGRFQCLHNEHMKYLLEGMKRCDYLIIGITNFDKSDVKDANINDLNRFLDSSNPFTYYERMEMIRDSMIEFGVNKEKFDIVPFPIENPEKIKNYVPTDAVFFMTIYDQWGEYKFITLNELGFNVEIMWKKNISEKNISGSMIRKLIREGEKWEHLVPKSVYDYIIKNNLIERI